MAGETMQRAREVLYGDVPLAAWAAQGQGLPWAMLRDAEIAIKAGRTENALELLLSVAHDRTFEARQRLEAWTALRRLDVTPPAADAAILEGVVVDVVLPHGRETLGAYRDLSAVYVNAAGTPKFVASGAAHREPIIALLTACVALLPKIGLWKGARPAFPDTQGMTRISLLTAAGLSIGQGPMNALLGDPVGAPVLGAAGALLQALAQ